MTEIAYKGWYSYIQYKTYTDECLNIGVIVACPDLELCDYQIVADLGRINEVFKLKDNGRAENFAAGFRHRITHSPETFIHQDEFKKFRGKLGNNIVVTEPRYIKIRSLSTDTYTLFCKACRLTLEWTKKYGT